MANTFKNSFVKAVGTSSSNVYVASGVQATVIGMSVANITTSPISANVFISSAGTDYFMVREAVIAPGGSLVPVGGDQKVVLESGDYMQVQSSAASSADIIVSVLEIS